MKVIEKATGIKKSAVYGTTPEGNKRMNVDGKFYTDKKFSQVFEILKTPEQNIAITLKGKKMLFLENDNVLDHGLEEFELNLQRAGIEYKVLFDLSELPFDQITKLINEYDGIIFQTRWMYDISKQLREYMFALKQKKVVIECYIYEPSFYYIPDSAHEVFIYSCMDGNKSTETFYKLSENPYWGYKNGFDK